MWSGGYCPASKIFAFCASAIRFGQTILDLVHLRQLQSVRFGRRELVDAKTACSFTAFVTNMAVHAPDVECYSSWPSSYWSNSQRLFQEFEQSQNKDSMT